MRSLPVLIFLLAFGACSSNSRPCGDILSPCSDPTSGGGGSSRHDGGTSSTGDGGGSSRDGGGDSVDPGGGGGGTTSEIKCERDGNACVCNHNADTNENIDDCTAAAVDSPGLCCADSAWPSSDQCTCQTVECTQDSLGDCTCAFGSNGTPVSSCPKPDNGACCMSEGAYGSTTCLCTEGSSGCGEGQTEVDSCSTGDITCTGDSREVSSCQ